MSTSKPPDQLSPEGNVAVFLVNAGVAILVLGSTWQLCFSPSSIDSIGMIKLALIFSGLGLLATGWFASLQVPAWVRTLLITVALTVVAFASYRSIADYVADGKIMVPARIQNDRWTHDGLGLSFAVMPGWTTVINKPYIRVSEYDRKTRFGRLRLWPNEQAIFCEIVRQTEPNGSKREPSSIVVQVGRFPFSSIDSMVEIVLKFKSDRTSQPGVSIIEEPHSYQINGIDFVEFAFIDSLRNIRTNSLFARCGAYLLYFVLEANCPEDLNQFQSFIESIRITDHTSTFMDKLF